jgi:AcrR family transcriptional regulator
MRNGAKTRERLDRAALTLFVEKGVAATTVRDLAAAADIAEGTIYRHYLSKEDLAWDLFRKHYTALAEALKSLEAAETTVRGKLQAMIGYFCRFFDEDPVLFSYLLLSQHGHLQRVTEEMANPVEVLCRVMAAGVDEGELPQQDPGVAAAMVLGLVLQVAVFRIYGRLNDNLSRLVETLTSAALRALGAADGDGAEVPPS